MSPSSTGHWPLKRRHLISLLESTRRPFGSHGSLASFCVPLRPLLPFPPWSRRTPTGGKTPRTNGNELIPLQCPLVIGTTRPPYSSCGGTALGYQVTKPRQSVGHRPFRSCTTSTSGILTCMAAEFLRSPLGRAHDSYAGGSRPRFASLDHSVQARRDIS